MANGFNRRNYDSGRFNLPRDELEQAMTHVRQAVIKRPDGRKPFVMLHGPPGVGKTWLFEQIREQCSTAGVRCADVVPAASMLADPDARLTKLLRWFLQDDTAEISSAPTEA